MRKTLVTKASRLRRCALLQIKAEELSTQLEASVNELEMAHKLVQEQKVELGKSQTALLEAKLVSVQQVHTAVTDCLLNEQ